MNAPEATVSSLPVVKVRNLVHTFQKGVDPPFYCLADISLDILPGEIVILMGPSGCGKTTLLTLLGALRTLKPGPFLASDPSRDASAATTELIPKEQGSIQIRKPASNDYFTLLGMTEKQLIQIRRMIGFIFQRHNLFNSLTALENVRMSQQLLGLQTETTTEAKSLLRTLGLEDKADYRPHALSGGQCQRVAIARALINKPSLILADEPTAALDAASATIVIQLLKDAARNRGATSLIVTHDEKILHEADRIIDMKKGRIVSNVVVKEIQFLYNGIRNCPGFAGMLPESQKKIAHALAIGINPDVPLPTDFLRSKHFAVYSPQQRIIRQDEIGNTAYLIRSGSVSITRRSNDSVVEHITTLGRGDVFGDRALITNLPRSADVIAQTRTEVYVIHRDLFQEELRKCITFITNMLNVYQNDREQLAAITVTEPTADQGLELPASTASRSKSP